MPTGRHDSGWQGFRSAATPVGGQAGDPVAMPPGRGSSPLVASLRAPVPPDRRPFAGSSENDPAPILRCDFSSEEVRRDVARRRGGTIPDRPDDWPFVGSAVRTDVLTDTGDRSAQRTLREPGDPDVSVGARRRRTPKNERPLMARPAQIAANRRNSKCSTGPSPASRARTRFNGLKHGLRSEHPVLPGEKQEEFDAEWDAWFDDWKPITHTRTCRPRRRARRGQLEALPPTSGSRRPGSPRRPRTSPTRSRPSGTTPSRGGCTCSRTCRPRRPTDSVATSAAWSGSSRSSGGRLGRAVEVGLDVTGEDHHDRLPPTCWGHKAGSGAGGDRAAGRWRAPPGSSASSAPPGAPPWDEAAVGRRPRLVHAAPWPTTGPASGPAPEAVGGGRRPGTAPRPSAPERVEECPARRRGKYGGLRGAGGSGGGWTWGLRPTSKEAYVLHRYEMGRTRSR